MNLLNELLQLCVEKSKNTEYNIHFDWFSKIEKVYVWVSSENVELHIFSSPHTNNEEELKKAIQEVKELV